MREVAVKSWDMVVDYFDRGLSLRAVARAYGVCHTTVWEAVQHYIGRFLGAAQRRAGALRLWGRAYVKACKASQLLDAVLEFEEKPCQRKTSQEKRSPNWFDRAREAAGDGEAGPDPGLPLPDLSEEARRYLEAKGRLCPVG